MVFTCGLYSWGRPLPEGMPAGNPMQTEKPLSPSDGRPVSLYLELWNLALILLGVTAMLILRPF